MASSCKKSPSECANQSFQTTTINKPVALPPERFLSDNTTSASPNVTQSDLSATSGIEQWQAVLLELVLKDVTSATRKLNSEVPFEMRESIAGAMALEVFSKNPDALPSFLAQLRNPALKKRALNAIAIGWIREAPQVVYELARTRLSGEDKNYLMAEAISATVDNNRFIDAKEMINGMPFSQERSSSIRRLAEAWGASSDQTHSYEWAKSLALGEDSQLAMGSLIDAMERNKNIQGLVNILNDNPNTELQRQALRTVFKIVAAEGETGEAEKWIAQLPSQMQDTATAQLIKLHGSEDVAKWTTTALQIKDKASLVTAITSLTHAVFTEKPEIAGAWVLGLPPSARRGAIGRLVFEWYDTDSVQLSDWIYALPKGTDRDYAIEKLIQRVNPTDHSAAKDLAFQIQDSASRQRVQAEIGQ